MAEKERGTKKYTRREFFKLGGKGVVGAAAGAAAGGAIGRAADSFYDLAKYYYRTAVREGGTRLKNVDEWVEKSDSPVAVTIRHTTLPAEKWRGNFWSKVFGRSEKEQEEFRRKYGISTQEMEEEKSRIQSGEKYRLRRQKVEYPRESTEAPAESRKMTYKGATLGGTLGLIYGTARGLRTLASNYKQASLMNELHTAYSNLQQAYGRLGEYERNSAQGEKVKEELGVLGEKIERVEQEGGLEKKVGNKKSTGKKVLLILGVIGLIISIILSSFEIFNTTGFSILENANFKPQFFSIILFLLSFIFIAISRFLK